MEEESFPSVEKSALTASQSTMESIIKAWIEGKTYLKSIIGLDDASLYFAANMGYHLFLQGKLQDARIIFEGIAAIDPYNSYYFRALGSIYWQQGDRERALRYFNSAVAIAPKEPLNYIGRAEIYVSFKKFIEAQQDLNWIIKRFSNKEIYIPIAVYKKARAIMKMIA